jgi:hypothetical protein
MMLPELHDMYRIGSSGIVPYPSNSFNVVDDSPTSATEREQVNE